MPQSIGLSLGDVARHFGCESWQVRRLYTCGKLPEPPRIAGNRVVDRGDLPSIGMALEKAGVISKGKPTLTSE